MKYGDLKAAILADVFPSGEAENLVLAHNNFFLQSITDLQRDCACFRFANTDFYPQCAGYFNCGLTVVPKPNGQIIRVYTIGKERTKGTAAGTVIGTVTAEPTLVEISDGAVVQSQPLAGTICTIGTGGLQTITVNQSNPLGSLYPANSPQYFRTEISYTDSAGAYHTIQPADLLHLSDTSKNGAVSIDCGAGTDVTYKITPFNIPTADGTAEVVMTVTFGSLLEDSDDWCSKVDYQQVEYKDIERYVQACQNCGTNTIWTTFNAILGNLFGAWRRKRRYVPPTDVGFENQPPLPHGFHYPQTSTDAGGRSPQGVYAIKHGRIYVAPWLESTESLVVEWNGIKTSWADTDLVSDDPLFMKAMRLNFAIQHYTSYEDNQERLDHFKREYHGSRGVAGIPVTVGVLRELIVDCRNKNQVRTQTEIGVSEPDYAEGVPILSGTVGGLFYNDAQSYTSNGVTINIPAGRYSSSLSAADANAQAISAATDQAQQAAAANPSIGSLFSNISQSFTASCPGPSGTTPAASGSDVTIVIPAGTYKATTQALADSTALAAAKAVANSQLVCTYFNAPQTSNVVCGDASTETFTIPAGQFTSTSQSDADSKATAEAQKQATALCNPSGSFTVGNTIQTVTYSFTVTTSCRISFPVAGSIIVPANTYLGQATPTTQAAKIASLNAQANLATQVTIQQLRAQALALHEAACWRPH